MRVRAEDSCSASHMREFSQELYSVILVLLSLDTAPNILAQSMVWRISNLPARHYRTTCMTNLVHMIHFDTAMAIIMVRYAWRNDFLRLQQLSSAAQVPHRSSVPWLQRLYAQQKQTLHY